MADEEIVSQEEEQTQDEQPTEAQAPQEPSGKKIKKNRKTNNPLGEGDNGKTVGAEIRRKMKKPFIFLASALLIINIISIIVGAAYIAKDKEYKNYFKDQQIIFSVEKREKELLDLWQMQEKVDSVEFDATYHPNLYQYAMQKNYKGFLLEDLLLSVFGEDWNSDKYPYVKFYSNDSDDVVYSVAILRKERAYIAFEVEQTPFLISPDDTSMSAREYGGPFVLILSGLTPSKDTETNETIENNRVSNVYQIALQRTGGR